MHDAQSVWKSPKKVSFLQHALPAIYFLVEDLVNNPKFTLIVGRQFLITVYDDHNFQVPLMK